MIRSHFAGGVSDPTCYEKRQFPKDGVRSLGLVCLVLEYGNLVCAPHSKGLIKN